MKKKAVSVLLTAALCCAAATPVFAADTQITQDSDPKTAETELTYSVETDYVVVIPRSVDLDRSIEISSTKANTEPGKAVKVRISNGLTDGNVTLNRKDDASGYSITAKAKLNDSDAAVTADTVIASFADVQETTQGTVGGTLTFGDPVSPDSNPIKAGSYSGTLTFTINYEDQNPSAAAGN